ncbi:MAG: hypothetical protein VKN83_01595 [Cyanobacteriota bacterium]|jgi:hypothetical protein|nr:hypothetical protein [Cyanobacteriota bacterium]
MHSSPEPSRLHGQRPRHHGVLALALLLSGGTTLAVWPAWANPADPACAAPQPGRYAVMGEGELGGEPIAILLQETWNGDGTLQGVRLERRGRINRESTYTGRFRPISNCRVAIERSYFTTVSTSQAVLDLQGRPRFSLGNLPDVLMVTRWFAQPAKACTASMLDGMVVSQQQGRDWRGGKWQPNAVVQREHWRGGQVKGVAISSYGPTVEEATYTGTIVVQPDCQATIQQSDSLGKAYNYRAIVLADGSGYLYLQTDPDDVTVAFLQQLSPPSPGQSQR